MTENKHKHFNILLFLLPILDLSSIFIVKSVTLSLVIKTLIIIYFLWYLFFITQSPLKKKSICYLYLIIMFIIYALIINIDYTYLLKLLLLPILFITLPCFYNDSGLNTRENLKFLLAVIIIYLITGIFCFNKIEFGLNGNIYNYIELFIMIFPILFIILKKKIYKNNKQKILSVLCLLIIIILIYLFNKPILLESYISIYIVLCYMVILNTVDFFDKNKIAKNKISIITFDLNRNNEVKYIINLANMISDKYNVELVNLYKTSEVIPYPLKKKIKIKYLTDLKPNRDEFKDAVKRKNIFKIFYQGVKALYILHLKKVLIRNYVEYSDAEIIISSRLDFTKALNQYGRVETKKYGVEHNYRVDSKYVNEIKKYTQNIDGLVLVSKTATDVYRAVLPALKIKNIPNTVSEVYTSKSKLNTENLISVGRLEPEKGFLDLLDVMNFIVKENQGVKLTIIGDGSEKEKLNEKIKKLNLENNIDLVGFKTPEEINEYYKESSLYVMTSLKESFGIVLLESMKCGVPAIAFDSATGATEIIEDNQNGYLVKNRNKEEMAEKIIEYLSLKDKKDLQKNALDTAKKYTNEIVQEKWLKLLEGSEHNERLF